MTNYYYNEIRSDIAKEFGLEAGGWAPLPKSLITIREAQRLNNKYSKDKATIIAKRLVSMRKANA